MIDLIKKIIIAALIIWGLIIFYKKFMASTLGPFFKEKARNVDFFGFSTPDYNKEFKE